VAYFFMGHPVDTRSWRYDGWVVLRILWERWFYIQFI